MLKLLELAGEIALPTDDNDMRNFWIGSCSIRSDGKLVSAKNGAVRTSSKDYQVLSLAHSEVRLARKLDKGAVVYVSRIRRKDRLLAMARPCGLCRNILKSKGIEQVYYTINPFQYGLLLLNKDTDRVFNC